MDKCIKCGNSWDEDEWTFGNWECDGNSAWQRITCNKCGFAWNCVMGYIEQVDRLTARIAELEAAQRWIPVSERLPDIEDGDSKDYDVVLTYPFRRDVIVATWSYDALDKTHRRRWLDCRSDEWGAVDITEHVTHWRERPTPPEVQE